MAESIGTKRKGMAVSEQEAANSMIHDAIAALGPPKLHNAVANNQSPSAEAKSAASKPKDPFPDSIFKDVAVELGRKQLERKKALNKGIELADKIKEILQTDENAALVDSAVPGVRTRALMASGLKRFKLGVTVSSQAVKDGVRRRVERELTAHQVSKESFDTIMDYVESICEPYSIVTSSIRAYTAAYEEGLHELARFLDKLPGLMEQYRAERISSSKNID